MDKLKLRLTITAAQNWHELLEQAITAGDSRATEAALHNLRRELATLAEIAKEPNYKTGVKHHV